MTHEPEKTAKPQPFFNVWRVGLCGLFVGSILLYWQSLDGQAVWDDHGILGGEATGGGTLEGALTKPFLSYFRPVASLSFLLDKALFGKDTFGSHLQNILLHAITVLLVAWLALLLTRKTSVGLLAGLAFAVQPAQVAATAWMGGRIDAISALLIALYVCLLVKDAQGERQSLRWLAALVLLIASLTKEPNVLFALLAPIVYGFVGRQSGPKIVRSILPAAISTVTAAALLIAFNPHLHHVRATTLEDALVRSSETAVHYALLLLGISPDPLFTFSLVDYEAPAVVATGAALLIGALAAALVAFRSRKPLAILVLGGAISYVALANVLPLPSLLVGPYRIAVTGIFVAVGIGLLAISGRHRLILLPLVAGLLVLNLATTWNAIGHWRTEREFFETVSVYDPRSLVAVENYTTILEKSGRHQEAWVSCESALDWIYGSGSWRNTEWLIRNSTAESSAMKRVADNSGEDEAPQKDVARLLFLRFTALSSLAQQDEAMVSLFAAERLDDKNSDVLAALGDFYLPRDRPRALAFYERAVAARPTDWENLRRLAKQRMADGRLPEAESLYRKTVELAPMASAAWLELSICLEQQGKRADAIWATEQGLKGFVIDRAVFEERLKELRSK